MAKIFVDDIGAIVRVLAFTWIAFFLGSRVYHFLHGYSHAANEVPIDQEILRICKTSPAMRVRYNEDCTHLEAVGSYRAIESGLKEMYSNTYLCGSHPCMQLVETISGVVAILGIVALIGAYVMLRLTRQSTSGGDNNGRQQQYIEGRKQLDNRDGAPLIEEVDEAS